MTDAFRLEDFSGYLEDLHKVKIQLHDAGSFCEMYHHSQNRELLKDLHKLINDMRKGSMYVLCPLVPLAVHICFEANAFYQSIVGIPGKAKAQGSST